MDPHSGKPIPYKQEIPFFSRQERFILHNCGIVDPGSIMDYIKAGGYEAIHKVLNEMAPLQVIAEIEGSGLRGLGGGGFLAGNKWRLCYQSPGDQKYPVCNAD